MTIDAIQTIRKVVIAIVVLGALAFFAVGTCAYDHKGYIHSFIKWTGFIAMAVCVLGRTWCSLYIGGQKIVHLVTTGPYSVSRNPLYIFSIIGAAGAGAQFGSISFALASSIAAFAVFRIVVTHEEKLLLKRHGRVFENYMAAVPRFLPDPRRWSDAVSLKVQPRNVLITFGDALLLLVFAPIADLFEHLQIADVLPVLIRLP